ncbi:MAG: U-box domain, partial [Gammaproteobacteria bacterium]|nr:U-box domain [Gammaproteobacteria bacterium]
MPSGRKHKKGGPREGSKAQMAQPDIRKNKKDLLKDEQLVPAALLEDDALAAEASDDEKHFEVDKRNLAELIDQFDSATSLKSTMEAIEDRVGACPLTCPISQIPINEMDDPVITSDGRVYEKRDILENMNKRGNINPMDGLPFKRNQPVPPNLLVRAAIIPGDNIDGIPAGPIPAENIRADLIPVGNIPTNLVPADFILGDLLAIHAQLQQSAREQFINIAEQMYTQQAAATQQASEQREKLKTAKAQMEQQQNETS